MTRISDYEGKLLSHLQGFFHPGDRDLAVELMEALGLACVEVRTSGDHSLTRVHVNAGDGDDTIDLFSSREICVYFRGEPPKRGHC